MVRPLKQMTIILSILKRKYTYFQCKEMKSRSNRNTLYKYNKDISDATEKLNQFYAQFNLELDHVTLREKNDSLPKFRLDIEKDNANKPCNKTMLNNISKLKDKTNLSERNYLKWKNVLTGFPSLYSMRKRNRTLNDILNIQNNSFGFFVDVRHKITFLMKQYFKKNPEISLPPTIKIKIAADGLQINKKGKQILMICFSFIDPSISPTSTHGHFILGK